MKNLIIAMTVLVSSFAFADSRSYTKEDNAKVFTLATLSKDQAVELKLNATGTSLNLLVAGKKAYTFGIPGAQAWSKGYLLEVMGSRTGYTVSEEYLSDLGCHEIELTGRVEAVPSFFGTKDVFVIDPDSVAATCL
ncbi:hypothetical protein [Peredibacter starrii]|uniref:Uncharacterized protein n=1 Tax=Peredibacter starrii TaxID=28202 RepID=A0AAX4HQ97_9BACT|nr:hypothetical protein [Peredibacter starrii]WPU65124.1 hypothetical protein SOO65_20720 [Peredibacter starrii]